MQRLGRPFRKIGWFIFGVGLLVLFVLAGVFTSALYSTWGRSWVISSLQEALNESGWKFSVQNVEGSLPEELTLHKVSISSAQGDSLTMETVVLRLALWRLLKSEITFSKFQADRIEIHSSGKIDTSELPTQLAYSIYFPHLELTHLHLPGGYDAIADVTGRIKIEKYDRTIHARLFVKLPDLRAEVLYQLKNDRKSQLRVDAKGVLPPFSRPGTLHLYAKGTWNSSEGFYRLSVDHLLSSKGTFALSGTEVTRASTRTTIQDISETKLIPLHGPLLIQGDFQGDLLHLTAFSSQLKWKQLVISGFHGTVDLKDWVGSLTMRGTVCGKIAEAESSCSLNTYQIQLQDFSLHSALGNASGDLLIDLDQKQVEGTVHLESEDLHAYAFCDPSWSLHGSAQANLTLKQETDLEITCSKLYYPSLQIEEGFLSLHDGLFYAEARSGRWNQFFWQTATLQKENDEWHLFVQGDWNGPFEFRSQGSTQFEKNQISVAVHEGWGNLLDHPIQLSSPTQFTLTPSSVEIAKTELGIAAGTLAFSFVQQPDLMRASLFCEHIPLDLFSANPLEVEIAGDIYLKGEYLEQGGEAQGSLNTELRRVLIATDEQNPLTATARLSADLAKEHLTLHTDVHIRSQQLLQAEADLQVRGRKLLFSAPASGSLTFSGQVEELLDFFDLGPNRLEGECKADFKFRGSLNNPELTGSLIFENGRYENYFTGTELTRLRAHWIAKHHELLLTSLSAQDGQNKGLVHAVGGITLLYQERFPFHFNGQFSRITALNTQWVQAELEGIFKITGDLDMAHIGGKAELVESDLAIPDHIPVSKPELVVKYLHAPEREERSPKKKRSYPIFFDYAIVAPDQIFISGHGLHSEWKGEILVTGSASNLELKGRYDLISGDFSFAGRTMNLSQGSLIFGGKPNSFPQLNIAAELEVSNISIIARLNGPLNNPILTLRSSPSLPTGVVLSYLLFDEDLTELNTVQATQLMASLGSLSQEGPSVLERTRQALGVDRLRVVATPLDDQGGKTYALQVGKYVSRNVLFSITQGTQGDSTNLGVEVNLGHGFIFQAEAQQEQEQGKFSLKWHFSY